MKNPRIFFFISNSKLATTHHPPASQKEKVRPGIRVLSKKFFRTKKLERAVPDVKLQVERIMILVAKLQTERPRVIFYLEELLANLRTIFRNHPKVEIIFVIKIDIVHVVFINK